MKNGFRQKNSIIIKLPAFAVSIIIIQSIFILAALIFGGVIKHARLNAYETFQNKVDSRKAYLELEMKNRWTNLDPFLRQISDELSQPSKSNQEQIQNLSQNVMDMLRASKGTGAFLVLIDQPLEVSNQSFSAIHIRDYDPLANDYDNKDLYMIVGPSEIAKEYKIPLDQTWSYDLVLNEENSDYITKPYAQADLSYDSTLLGYWSQPFNLSEKDLEIITYSMPIFDSNGELRGVVGIEITLNYLTQLLPATDIKLKNSLGYMLVYQADEASKYQPMVMTGALQKRYIKADEALIIEEENDEAQIFQLINQEGREKIYLSLKKINLYRPNTPFEEESWFLAGMMHEDDLFSYVYRIQKILAYAFIFSLIVGILGGFIFSYRFAKPIVKLSKSVRENRRDEKLNIEKTGLAEVDDLALAMEEVSRERIDSASRLSRIISLLDMPIGAFEIRESSDQVFLTEQFLRIVGESHTDKRKFKEFLEEITQNPIDEEDDIFHIEGKDEKWIKLKKIEMDYVLIGIIQDVTEEVRQKHEIRQERDLDGLTNVLNHRAFKSYMNKILGNKVIKTAALLMFDLDNLKHINDTYGHKWGDYYIRESANRLQIIADRDQMLLGRRSGDEFVLLLHGFDNKVMIRETIDRFYEYLQKSPLIFPDQIVRQIYISGGLTWIKEWPTDYDELLHNADEVLYKSKFESKGTWSEYTSD
jgi:diguanylate cyclase (GGDEF)-like protein